MSTANLHCTSAQLQAKLDGRLEPEERAQVENHLRQCPSCSRAYASFSSLDASLRKLPLSGVNASLTQNVLNALRLDSRASLLYRFLLFVPYAFGLLIVLGTIAAAFLWSGAFQETPAAQTIGEPSQAIGAVSEAVRSFSVGLAQWISEYFPFFSQRAAGISLLLLLALLCGAGVDRLIGRKMVVRTR